MRHPAHLVALALKFPDEDVHDAFNATVQPRRHGQFGISGKQDTH